MAENDRPHLQFKSGLQNDKWAKKTRRWMKSTSSGCVSMMRFRLMPRKLSGVHPDFGYDPRANTIHQSNGRLKTECIRPGTPLAGEDAVRLIQTYVARLQSAIGYVTPQDTLAGRQSEIHAARDRKLEEARQ
jgi:hypothetical protein